MNQQTNSKAGPSKLNLIGAMTYGSQEEVRPRSSSKSGKKQPARASSENRYKGQQRTQNWQQTKANNYFPLSLENTSGNLAQNLKNINA